VGAASSRDQHNRIAAGSRSHQALTLYHNYIFLDNFSQIFLKGSKI